MTLNQSCLEVGWQENPVCAVPYLMIASMLLYMFFHVGLLIKLKKMVLTTMADQTNNDDYLAIAGHVLAMIQPVLGRIEALCHELVEQDLTGTVPTSTAFDELVGIFQTIIR